MSVECLTPNSARVLKTYPLTPEELLARTRQAVRRLPRWRVGSVYDTGLDAVRTTRFLRFEDDVAMRVKAREGGSRIEISSASRVGYHDLGQNPRNLRELLEALRRELETG